VGGWKVVMKFGKFENSFRVDEGFGPVGEPKDMMKCF
jgi:hypothetical protein